MQGWYRTLPGLIVFSDAKPTSELSEGMLWMEDRGMSVSVLVNHVDSVSLVQLSRYRGSRASVLLPPQPIARPRGDSAPIGRQQWGERVGSWVVSSPGVRMNV